MKPRNDFLTIKNATDFHRLALETFRYQYEQVLPYQRFCRLLHVHPKEVKAIEEIPFLPIQFFKSEQVINSATEAVRVFQSSGTTGNTTSKHYIADLLIYEKSFMNGFRHFYGDPTNYTILALLPSYLTQGNSSLIYMVDALITRSKSTDSGFYLDNLDDLCKKLEDLDGCDKKTLLIGVSYALLDLLDKQTFTLKNTLVMETGGMKGRRKELIKPALHQILKKGFGVTTIHSEYGMTELLSQAYSSGDGLYRCPPWMQILTRDTEDARTFVSGTTGGINIIDLANLHSCAFIATQDLGKTHADGSFEVIGRFDNSDIRGCNLMVL